MSKTITVTNRAGETFTAREAIEMYKYLNSEVKRFERYKRQGFNVPYPRDEAIKSMAVRYSGRYVVVDKTEYNRLRKEIAE